MQAIEGESSALRHRVQLLGPFRLSHAGRDIALAGRKARGILAFLALAPDHRATREQLAALLWSDRGAEQARASLRQSLKELRELPSLAGAFDMGRDTVTFAQGVIAVDLHEIRQAAAARELGPLAALLDQARGELLADLLDVSPGFDEWLEAERPRQHDLVLADTLDAVEADGLADMKNTRSILRSLDRLDPVNEAVVRLGMRLDHAVGDGASLHRRYRQLCDRLDSEFDALPSEDTRALFHQLAVHPGAAPVPTATSPPPPPPASAGGDMVPLVVVAPLQTGGDEALASLAALCADDVRVSLSRMRGIHVLAADEGDLDGVLQQGGEALGVYLFSGSLRRFGADIRVTVQLANATSRVILWSDTLRFAEADEAMLDQLVGKATGAIAPAIDRDLDTRLRRAAAELHDERAAFARARLLIRSGAGLPAVREGVRLLEAIVAANPQHFGAHLLLARMYSTDFWQQIAGHDVAAFRDQAEQHLQAAAGIEPGHYAVRIGQAWRHLRRGDGAAARREFEAILANLPHDADVTNGCALGLGWLGSLDEADQLMQRAFFLNPFPPSDYHADYAVVLALKGEHEAAEEHFGVSGESGLMYVAARIANAARLADGAERISPTLAQFTAAFRSAWQGAGSPTVADALDWVGYTLALNSPEALATFRQDLRQMLEPTWPATPGSGR